MCRKLKVPNETTAKALSNLFPACMSKKRKFNPLNNNVAVAKKCKAANSPYKGRSKAVQVVMLKESMATLPRGLVRDKLKDQGRIRKIYFHRVMSQQEVHDTVIESFKDLGVTSFRFLVASKDNSMALTEKQTMCGDSVITVAGSGSLYLQELSQAFEECSDTEKTGLQKVCLIAN